MLVRLSSLLLLVALSITPSIAKDKKKTTIPEDILRAHTVRVAIDPDAGEPLDQPRANYTARDNVEKALLEWGRFSIVMDGQEADLVLVVRRGGGRAMRPTIQGGPIDQRPGVAQSTDSTIRIGGQRGQPTSNDPNSYPQNQGPRIGNEMGPSQDMLAVYRGNIGDPLDSSPVWRYIAKDCLQAPEVSAVEQFRKAIAEAEKPKAPAQQP